MKQFVLPEDPDDRGEIRISGRDFHYLHRVRKIGEGMSFQGLSPAGESITLTVKDLSSDNLTLSVSALSPRQAEGERAGIVLYQCLPKGQKMDLVVRQATEAGAEGVVPVLSEYSIPRLDGRDCEKKRERWERIAREATQQCGAPLVPRISAPIPLKDLPPCGGGSLGLVFHHEPLENNTLHGYLSSHPKDVRICIGPEGGFSERELGLLSEKGYKTFHVRTNVLRTETAALFAIAAVEIILLEIDSWAIQQNSQQSGSSY